jgi:hypothetical protein
MRITGWYLTEVGKMIKTGNMEEREMNKKSFLLAEAERCREAMNTWEQERWEAKKDEDKRVYGQLAELYRELWVRHRQAANLED